MRLIDADEIKYQLLIPNTNPTLWCVSKDAVDWIPTVDAVPVAHGKWIEKTGTLNDATFWWYECSECGERPLKYYGSDCLSRFCPNCGASMGEVTE